jgi:hypothetical protein
VKRDLQDVGVVDIAQASQSTGLHGRTIGPLAPDNAIMDVTCVCRTTIGRCERRTRSQPKEACRFSVEVEVDCRLEGESCASAAVIAHRSWRAASTAADTPGTERMGVIMLTPRFGRNGGGEEDGKSA